MAYSKTVWKARQGVNLNKFTKSQETDTSVVLTNTPDSITEPGTPFSAENMNHIEEGIAEVHKAIINYSTVEQDTKIKWINGKPIYQKTFNNVTRPEAVANIWVTIETVANLIPGATLIVDGSNLLGGPATSWRIYNGSIQYFWSTDVPSAPNAVFTLWYTK